MHDRKIALSWVISLVSVWVGSCVFCAISIPHLYGIHVADILYSYGSVGAVNLAIWRACAIATFFSTCLVGLALQRRLSAAKTGLLAWAATFLGLALYGFAGCGGVLGEGLTVGHLHISMDPLFPSLIFAEFNFLTFMFEVAPLTAIVAAVIAYLSLKLCLAKIQSEPRIV
ncbi:MAG: hypothetical protein ACLPM3_02065 [Terracidiphilus sp.]